jgi:hypothetical protein
MSKLDIKLVEKMYADYGQELTPDRIEYIKGEFSNNNDFSNSFLRKYDLEKSASEIKVEKKNPDTTGTSSVAQSDSQEPPRKKRSLSVGGKLVQAGASGSSVGKNKGERSSEQLLSELGFKNKEEQKKAGAVASKVKVGGATPVGVKSTPKKEEVFKTEKQKAVEKEVSLITEKYKREEEEKFVEEFRVATAIPEGYEDQVKEEINSELQGTGFWNTISQGASEAWNKVLPYIPGAPSSESELKQLEAEVTFLPKAKEEYRNILIKQGVNKDEITDEVLTKGAIDLEVKKRVEDKKVSLANDYLDNLPNDVKERMESKALNEVQINNPEVTKGFNLLKTLDADIKKDNDELVKLEELSKKNNGLSPEDADRYGSLTASLKSKIESRNKQYNSYKEKVSKLTTAEQEYDLFKRTYGFEDKAGKILNSVADFGLGAVQFMNMLTPGANQDNIALELAGIKNQKDKLVAEKFQKQVDDAKNINDVLDYGSDVLISQTPNIALGYLTGGTSMLVGIGTSATGNKYSELLTSNMEGKTDYSKLQMYLSSGIYGAAETLESNTLRMIGGAKNVIGKAIKNEPSRKLFAEGLATKTYKTGKEFLKNYKGELKEELTTFGAQKISDIVVLDIDSKDVFKNAKEEIKSLVKDTGVMVVGLNLFPATFAKVINTFSPKDYTYNLDKNNKMIDDLSKILNNKDASDVVKSEAKSKIDQIVKSNEDGLIKVVKNTSKLDDKLVDKVVEIEIKNSELRNKANQINEDKTISKDQKKILLSGLKDEFTKNELLREDIVGGRKSSFDILPEDQSTKFKEEAANLLKKEELDKGVEEGKINISAEDINNKAKELYNQKINKENEKSTGETDTKEKSSGINAEQTISAVQQEDGNARLQSQEEVSKSNIQEDAVQKQSTNEGLLQPEQSEMGLQKMDQGNTEQEVVAEQSKEKVDGEKLTYKSLDGTASGVTLNNERNRRSVIKIERDVELKEEVNKALDRLSKAYDAYKNVNVIFDPEGQWKKDKELVSSLVDYAVSNIKLGAYNASNLLKDLKSKGFEITKEAAEFIFQKASGPSLKESTANTKAEVTELKGQMQDLFSSAKEALKMEKDKTKVINKLKGDVNNFVKVSIQDLKAGDIGKRALASIASKVQQITDQNFEEKLGEVNDILDNLYTNRDVNKAKSDKKKALKNVMSGKVGKLDKRGDRDKVMSSKIVNFALLNPETLKKVLDDSTFGLYTDYINRLGERKDALSDTDLKSYENLYDEITIPYKKYTDKVNEIQGKIDTNVDLSDSEQEFVDKNKSDFYEKEDVAGDEEADADKKAKKEAEILKKKDEIKSFIPLMKDVFEQSNAEKGSFEWKILSTLVNLDDIDVDSMPENMLTNAINALRSMVDNDVIPTYAEDLYRYTIKNKAKNLLAETVSEAGKGGLYKTKVGRAALKAREILGNPLTTIRGLKNGDVDAELLEKRIKMFRLSAIDAALKIYGDTPIFDGIMSVLGKGMSNLASTEARAEEALLNAKKLIDRKSKNPQESYMKITYYLIDAMAKNNQGTKSDVEAMEYFEKTVSDPNSKIRENKKALKVVEDFITKVKGDNGVVNLTPDEATAANAIRIVLEENQINAYEANLFQNANAAPMISEYFPVSNSLKSQTDTDIKDMQGRFALNGAVSTKSGNLEEKSGKAHPIDMNPFTTAFSSIKNTAVQFNLRSEYLGISGGLQEAINEAVENGDRDSELFLNGIRKALESEFDLIINGASFGSNNLMDDVFNAVDRTFYQVMLGSVISRSVDFTGNLIQLAALNPKLLVSGSKILKDLRGIKEVGESEVDLLREFYKNAEASDINKMISAKSSTTERTEFLNKGVSKSVLSKGLPTLNIFSKPKAKVIDPIDEKLTGINEGLISMSDVKPYGIAWNSIFRDAFLKEAGQEVDVAKIARGDKEYLKANKESIRKASNQANRESADLFGSTNPFERQIGIMEVAAGKKNSRNPLSALANRAKYFLSGFTIGANTSMTTSINTFVENQDPRELRKALGGAVRMGMYTTTVSAISSLLWSLFKGDDEDEDKLAESFDRLSEDDKFIKKMNNLFLDFPIQKDRDGNQVKLSIEDFKKYNKLRDELLSNEDFKNAYDIYYKYINRNLFDNAVRLRANELNSTKKKLFKEDIIVFFDDIKNGFPKTDQEIINALAIMHSEEGAKLFTSEEVDGYILDIENHMAKIGFLDKRALRSAESQIDRIIINETAMLLSEHRNSSASDIVVEEGAKLLMGLMFPRSNNLIKGSYNYLAEGANKMMIQSRRGDRGYDVYKDMIFQPIIKSGLSDKTGTAGATKEIIGILNPALKDLLKKDNADAATVSMLRYIKTIGTIGLNDFNKINSKMKNDNIYQKTNGRFKENIINDIAKDKVDIIRGVTDKEGLEEDLKNKEAYKSRVLPGIKSTEVKSKLPSYMDKKDLKINGRSVE